MKRTFNIVHNFSNKLFTNFKVILLFFGFFLFNFDNIQFFESRDKSSMNGILFVVICEVNFQQKSSSSLEAYFSNFSDFSIFENFKVVFQKLLDLILIQFTRLISSSFMEPFEFVEFFGERMSHFVSSMLHGFLGQIYFNTVQRERGWHVQTDLFYGNAIV